MFLNYEYCVSLGPSGADGQSLYIRHGVSVPRIGTAQLLEPLSSHCVRVLVTVQDSGVYDCLEVYCEADRRTSGLLWKCTPASGCNLASFSSSGQVFLSLSAAGVPFFDTLRFH